MPERITKLQRWLDLIAYLVSRRTPATFEEIAGHVRSFKDWDSDVPQTREAIRRMFERDKDELRAMGIPIKTVSYSMNFGAQPDIEGYVIDNRDFYLPYLRLVQNASPRRSTDRHSVATVELSATDASAMLEGLRRVAAVPSSPFAKEARSAFRKLAFDLDPDAFSPDSPVLFMEPPGTEDLVEALRELSEALLARKRVKFRYHGIYRGEETRRDVEPYGLLFQEGHWYLIARDTGRDAVRVFRAGRMDDVRANRASPHTPDYEIPSDFALDTWVGRAAWELGDADEPAIEVDVRFRFPLSLWAERNQRGTLLETQADGASVRRFRVLQVSAFLRWLLGLGGEAEIQHPPEVRTQLLEMASRVADMHGGEGA
jgi:proteasome accessory factor B